MSQGPNYQLQQLVSQNSVYNLKIEEVQSQLGNREKFHHSMNSVYNLKNMISTESEQLIQNPTPDINSSFLYGNTSGSGNNLNETMCNKTINEVWSEINQQKNVIGSMDHNNLQQSILGETTLDNFLTHAKAINIGNQENVHVIGDETQVPFIGVEPNLAMASQQEDWLPLQMQMPIPLQMQMPSIRIHQEHQDHHHHCHQNQPIIGLCPDFGVANSVYENKLMEIGYSEIPIGVTTMSLSSTCSDSKGVDGTSAGGGGVGRKHKYSDEMMEKTIERKQKRMAKNRESAARSRAKKQVTKICHCGQA